MHFLAVDNAEKCAAACLLSQDGQILGEWAHQQMGVLPYGRWVRKIIADCRKTHGVKADGSDLKVRVEDVFPGVALTASYKGAVKNQGVVELLFLTLMPEVSLDYIRPNIWQTAMGWKGKKKMAPKTTKSWAKDVCNAIGYEVPKWYREMADSSKALEDLRDARLIAQHLYDSH